MAGMFRFLVAAVIRPIRSVVLGLKDIAQREGDLTKRMPVDRKDEIGELANWFNVFSDKLHTTIRKNTGSAETLRFSSETLTDLSGAMRHDVTTVEGDAGAIRDDAATITTNINAVASAMEQTSINIGIIAYSAEEITEISTVAQEVNEIVGTIATAIEE